MEKTHSLEIAPMISSFPPDLAAFVQNEVALGKFPSEGALLEAAVRRYQQEELAAEDLRREIQLGLDEFERGEFTTYDKDSISELFERIKREGRAALAAEQNAKP